MLPISVQHQYNQRLLISWPFYMTYKQINVRLSQYLTTRNILADVELVHNFKVINFKHSSTGGVGHCPICRHNRIDQVGSRSFKTSHVRRVLSKGHFIIFCTLFRRLLLIISDFPGKHRCRILVLCFPSKCPVGSF